MPWKTTCGKLRYIPCLEVQKITKSILFTADQDWSLCSQYQFLVRLIWSRAGHNSASYYCMCDEVQFCGSNRKLSKIRNKAISFAPTVQIHNVGWFWRSDVYVKCNGTPDFFNFQYNNCFVAIRICKTKLGLQWSKKTSNGLHITRIEGWAFIRETIKT